MIKNLKNREFKLTFSNLKCGIWKRLVDYYKKLNCKKITNYIEKTFRVLVVN